MSLLRSSRSLRVLLIALLGLVTLSVGVRSASAAGTWSDAVALEVVPHSLNSRWPGYQYDLANGISCSARGACTFGGAFNLWRTGDETMIATMTDGVWSAGVDPFAVNGQEANRSQARVLAVSCSAPGDCAIGGLVDGGRAFVATKAGGIWLAPQEVAGIPVGETVRRTTAVSCSAAGECVAAGDVGHPCDDYYCYETHAFVTVQTGGIWSNASTLPGLEDLNTGRDSRITSVSCSSPGNCMVGGYYNTLPIGTGRALPFVASMVNGVWSNATTIPGIGPGVSKFGLDVPKMTVSVSCPSDGNCIVGGFHNTVFEPAAEKQGFVATRSGGTWTTVLISDLLAPGASPRVDATVTSVSCASATDCTAVGKYAVNGGYQGFIATLSGGNWTATPVPGLAALNAGNDATVTSVSCSASGTCALGGSYLAGQAQHAFVAARTSGAWSDAIPVPGLIPMNTRGMGSVTAVSCSPAGDCTVTGLFEFQAPGVPDPSRATFFSSIDGGGTPPSSTSTTTTIDGSGSSDGSTDGSGSSGGTTDGSGSSRTGDGTIDDATTVTGDPVAPAFTG